MQVQQLPARKRTGLRRKEGRRNRTDTPLALQKLPKHTGRRRPLQIGFPQSIKTPPPQIYIL